MGERGLQDIDLTHLDRFAHGFPYDVFEVLRREAPVWQHPPTEHTPGGEPFWVLSRHADIVAAAGDAQTFSSDRGGGRSGGGTLIEDLPGGTMSGVLLNMMDDPRHGQIRRLLRPSVAPRALRLIEDDLQQRAERIVAEMLDKQECDFLIDVAAELPLQAVAQLLGVPQQDRHSLFGWANATLDYEDRDLGQSSERTLRAQTEMSAYGNELLQRKRVEPADDLLSLAVHARVDGEPLTGDEAARLFGLLIAAGSETTRNSIAMGMLALIERPGEWRRLQEDGGLLENAIEEMLRWASSTPYNRRTATRDVTIRGRQIRAGEKVTLWWASANRDEDVFERPTEFDIERQPNPHLAFGWGSHFCLGSGLARMEMRVVFRALLDRIKAAELTGPVEFTRSNKHSGVRHMPVRLLAR